MAIKDMQGRVNVGCVLAVGRKGPSGAPVERDRFHIVWPTEDDAGRRPAHPQFRQYNEAKPEARRQVFGVLTHATQDACFEYAYRAQAPKGEKAPPSRRPWCTGDGETAMRFAGMDGQTEVFRPCACPGRLCPYQQTEPAGCKAHMRLLFMLAWREGSSLPAMLGKFTSNSYHTTAGVVGFFGALYGVAASFGLAPEQVNLAGLRFVLTLTERKNAARRSRYPVVTMTPVDDIPTFLEQQVQRSRAMLSVAPRAVAALTDRSQTAAEVEAADYDACEVDALDEALERHGLTVEQLDAYLMAASKPRASEGTREARGRLAAWLDARPEVIGKIRTHGEPEQHATTEPAPVIVVPEPADGDF